jgi:hypothetical protein
LNCAFTSVTPGSHCRACSRTAARRTGSCVAGWLRGLDLQPPAIVRCVAA